MTTYKEKITSMNNRTVSLINGRTMAEHLLLFIVWLICPMCSAFAQVPDEVNEDFVIASLLVASPGEALYSRAGHCALRMQCPEHNLDYVFSYESESISHRIPAFLSGKLKMGMFAIETADYISTYGEEGRGVMEYTLNIPIESKRNLWRVLDNHMMQGSDLPYDYITRGCAYSTLMLLKEGIAPMRIEYGKWPEKFRTLTRRELTGLQMDRYPWTWAFLNIICNGAINDAYCSLEEKVIMPADLVEVLSAARLDGKPLITSQSVLLQTVSVLKERCPITPLIVSLLILVLAIVCALLKNSTMDYVLLIIQTALGLLTVYLVFFSDLCCTEWSWHIVPFNPLPLVFWKWRKHWALPYACIIGLWVIVMLVYPHRLTDYPYIVTAVSLMISYLSMIYKKKKENAI